MNSLVRSKHPAPRIGLILTTALAGCSGPVPVAEPNPSRTATDSAGFVTRLGADTLALESFVRGSTRMEAIVVLRVPTTSYTRYVMDFLPNGQMSRLESTDLAPVGSAPARREVITRVGDSLRIEVSDTGAMRVRTVVAPLTTLPFIDIVHWPYELVAHRAALSGDSIVQPLLTGRSTSDFRVSRIGEDSITITHPFRGTMRAQIDRSGRILGLDAGGTTRKLTVQRTRWTMLEDARARWAALDRAGKSIGALSGRGASTATLGGATVKLDFGTPAKRGRDIWGSLVQYGQLWRTGANIATHIETDRDLVLGAGSDTLVVPAGKYTLYSIPERDGGVLIVNRQTGQGGTTYDAARDLGRVRLTARPLTETVELFTVLVTPAGSRGELRLQWDRTELVTPVRAR